MKGKIKTTETIIKINVGLDARPATLFVQTATKYLSDISIAFNEKTANAKSLIDIMVLGGKRRCHYTD